MSLLSPKFKRINDVYSVSSEPSLTIPTSQVCTENQFYETAYKDICFEIKEDPKTHRKQWEFCYITQTLKHYGLLKPRLSGIGFGVGEEPLPALFASYGCNIIATDLNEAEAAEKGWVATDQHLRTKEILNQKEICDPESFDQLVDIKYVDMNNIPDDLGQFDFTWSSCALEHLGSIDNSLEFIINSTKLLKPGGIAVHTTELNLSNDGLTLETGETVLLRISDFDDLSRRISNHSDIVLSPFNFFSGTQPLDTYIDVPPYSPQRHLKLSIGKYVTTSVGIIVRKIS